MQVHFEHASAYDLRIALHCYECAIQALDWAPADQASAVVCRHDEHMLAGCLSEQGGSVNSLPESVQTASTHMAALRQLLMAHMHETLDDDPGVCSTHTVYC